MPSNFLQSVRSACRLRGFGYSTEKTYVYWIRRYIYFLNKEQLTKLGSTEVEAFLIYLAEKRHMSVNTQKVALHAVVFMYRHVMKKKLGDLDFVLSRKQR